MGAKAGRKGARTYNILTCGVGAWRKYLDKKRRKSAKRAAIEEQAFEWCPYHTDADEDATCAYCYDYLGEVKDE